MRLFALLAATLLLPSFASASALSLTLPGNTTVLSDEVQVLDDYALPLGPFQDGALPVKSLTGKVQRSSWRVGISGLSAQQLRTPLEEQLISMGYEVLFQCSTQACGGFDFRFETEVLSAPQMHVDLGDYHFLSLQKGGEDHVGLMVSRSANAGFIQMIHVTMPEEQLAALQPDPTGDESVETVADGAAPEPAMPKLDGDVVQDALIATLREQGHVVLDDLAFATGSADLGVERFASLATLAGFLRENAARRVVLVGHTDAQGALDGNIDLSRRRARSVRSRMVKDHGVSAAQLEAAGMGYLAPRASNLSPEGREENRRVEAVLLAAE